MIWQTYLTIPLPSTYLNIINIGLPVIIIDDALQLDHVVLALVGGGLGLQGVDPGADLVHVGRYGQNCVPAECAVSAERLLAKADGRRDFNSCDIRDYTI